MEVKEAESARAQRETSAVCAVERPSAPLDDPGSCQHPRVRRGRSPPDAIPSGHFSDAGGERAMASGWCAIEVEDGQISSRAARASGDLCHGESIDGLG